MPSPIGIESLSDAVLDRLFDPGSLARGRDYAARGRVRLLPATAGTLKSVVEGSGRRTYLVRVEWGGRPEGVTLGDDCSCPIGNGCKHVVATILTARRAAPASVPEWRRALAGIVDGPPDELDAQARPLALEIVAQPPRSTRYGQTPELRATVRPLRLGANGRWVRTGASWRDLQYRHVSALGDLNSDQVTVLKSMLAGARLSSYYPDTQPIALSAFGSDLWFHLRRATDAGIELVGANGAPGAVALASHPAQATIDLTIADHGAVTLSAVVVHDGRRLGLDPDHTGVLGAPAHGLYHLESEVLHLIPLAEPLHAGLAHLLTAPPVVVPEGDVDELMTSYQPALARLAPVASSDGSVTITTTELDGLALVVERTATHTADLRWMVRYRRGEHVSLHPLHPLHLAGRTFRDQAGEQAVLDALEVPVHLLPALAAADGSPCDTTVEGGDTVVLLDEVVPWLRSRGQVDVEIVGDLPDLREAVADPLISLRVGDVDDDADRTDWFDLDVEVSVDGEPIPFTALFAALAGDEQVLILPSGTWLRLDRPELARLKALIDEAHGLVDHEGAGAVRINRFQTGWWDELAALGVVGRQSKRWADHVARMGALAAPQPVEPPAGLEATLRHYQREGLDWLVFLYQSGLGGILADDMGLGKTVQTLALCLHVLADRPDARFLVVAPTSVVENWHHEAAQFAPALAVQTIHETATRRGITLSEAIGEASMVVTSYALFRIEFDDYASCPWDLLLLDEAQFVKNHQSKSYQCVRRLDATTKVAITGTPLENSLMDLWSLLSITAPGLFPDPRRFSEVYRRPIEGGQAPELLATLRRRIAPLMRRRTKDEVLAELPPKTEQTVEVELSPRHARIYQTHLQRERQKVLGLVGDVQKNRFQIFKSLTMLRQLSLDPGLVDPKHDEVGSAKLDRLEEDLAQVVAEGHRALVFSQFTRYLARVRTRLDRAGIGYAYLDGRTRKRDEAITKFKSGDVPVFVISLKAGGFGLNLTEADYCFVLDPWWNPAVETQAIDRTHRIGQLNPVMVYRYVSVGTIEEKVTALQARKAALFADVMDADGALSGALTGDDIRGLLELP